MKKLLICLTTALLLTTLSSNQVLAASLPARTATASPDASAAANAMMDRLNEIKAMDKSTLSRSEKAELRTEVLSIKEALRHRHGVIYLSGGAILLIILLVILL